MDKNADDKCKCKFPCKRDFWYIVIIAGIINIGIITNYCYYNEGFVSKVEFASTLASIILSVIAIVLTLTESSKTARANEEILESSTTIQGSTDNINTSIEKLTNITKELSELHIDSELLALKKILKSVNERVCTVSDDLISFKYSMSKSFFQANTDIVCSFEKHQLENWMKKMFESANSSLLFKLVIYLLYQTHKYEKLKKHFSKYVCTITNNKELFAPNIVPNMDNGMSDIMFGAITGTLSVLRLIGCASFNESHDFKFIIDLENIIEEYEKANPDVVNKVKIFIDNFNVKD